MFAQHAPILLAASIIALFLGPWLVHRFQKNAPALAVFDGFAFVTIAGIVFLHILPESVSQGSLWSLAFLMLGLIGPVLVERWLHRAAKQAHFAAVSLALAGWFIHTLFDGAALSENAAEASGGLLPVAVLLHRLSEGLTAWILLRPLLGFSAMLLVLCLMGAGTVLGYLVGDGLESAFEGTALAWFQAMVAGSVMHVLIHRPHRAGAHPPKPLRSGAGWTEGIGNMLGIVLVVVLGAAHGTGHHQSDTIEDVLRGFLALALESAPALLLGYLLAGLLDGFLPNSSVRCLQRGNPFMQAQKGILAGLPQPLCGGGVLPLYRGLVAKGVPTAAAMAFLIATPELGLDALMLSLPLLGPDMTLLRIAAAVLVAGAVGALLGALTSPAAPAPVCGEWAELRARAGIGVRAVKGARYAFGELVDHTGPWILLGLLLAAALEPFLHDAGPARLPDDLEVLLFALSGVPVYVCAAGATPVVAVFLANGVSPGAALAFLITGPATNFTTFGVLKRLHGSNTACLFALTTTSASILVGLSVNRLLPAVAAPGAADLWQEQPGRVEQVSLAVLAMLYAASLLRRGARNFFREIFASGRSVHG